MSEMVTTEITGQHVALVNCEVFCHIKSCILTCIGELKI